MLALANLLIAFRGVASMGMADIAVAVVAALVALVIIALRKFEVQIPDWAVKVFWVLVVASVVILAIRFVASL